MNGKLYVVVLLFLNIFTKVQSEVNKTSSVNDITKLYKLNLETDPKFPTYSIHEIIERGCQEDENQQFIRRIPIFSYSPQFLGYLDEHVQKKNQHLATSIGSGKKCNLENTDEDLDRTTDVENDIEVFCINKDSVSTSITESSTTSITTSTVPPTTTTKISEESLEVFLTESKTNYTIDTDEDDDEEDEVFSLDLHPYHITNDELRALMNAITNHKFFKETKPLKALLKRELRRAKSITDPDEIKRSKIKYLEILNILKSVQRRDSVHNACKQLFDAETCSKIGEDIYDEMTKQIKNSNQIQLEKSSDSSDEKQ